MRLTKNRRKAERDLIRFAAVRGLSSPCPHTRRILSEGVTDHGWGIFATYCRRIDASLRRNVKTNEFFVIPGGALGLRSEDLN